jgi:ribosomal protein S18 acetylase RimI-like enzyme
MGAEQRLMSTDVAIRRAGLDDLRAVLRLWQEAEVTPPGPTDTLQGLTRLIRHPGGLLLVAIIDGRIVGSVIGGWDGWRGSIYRLAVTAEYRRRGIARELVAAISSTLFANGAERISALVEHEHAWATGFWDSIGGLGYHSDPQFTRYIADREGV